MGSIKTSIPHNLVKDLFNSYLHLKQKKHHAVKVETENDKPRIMIIGGGLSGFAAAKELTRHGINVLMIEAKNRIGGRIETVEFKDNAYVELGAQFLHGIKDNALFEVCASYGIEVKPYTRGDWAIYNMNGTQIDKNKLSDLVIQYKHLLKSLSMERHSDNTDRFTAEDLKNLDSKLSNQDDILSSDLGTLAKMISIKELNEEKLFEYKLGVNKKESESNFLVMNGFSKLIIGLLEDVRNTGLFQLVSSAQITKLDYTQDEVIAYTRNGESFNADAVICTLPLGVLKHHEVEFNPPLPHEKVEAINKLETAIQNKVILEFDEVFWNNDLSHFVVLYDPTYQAWVDVLNLQFFHQDKMPILVLSVYSNPGQDFPDDKYIVNHFVNLLKRIYPDTFRPLKNHWVTHWNDDPFAFGSYSYHPKGSSLEDNSEIAKPIGRLIFAGEHTHRSPSNMQAAYLSGLESARQVIEQLNLLYTSMP